MDQFDAPYRRTGKYLYLGGIPYGWGLTGMKELTSLDSGKLEIILTGSQVRGSQFKLFRV